MNRRRFLTTATAATAAVCATGPTTFAAAAPRARTASDTALLRTWLEATYRSITAMTTDFGLTADKIDASRPGTPVPSTQTSPTNIGCGMWSTVAAAGVGVISPSLMHDRLARTVAAVERLERAHGFWFNWYDAHDGSVLTSWPENGDTVRPFLSTVDNAWLVTGLKIAADADSALRPRIARLLAEADWSYFYTPYDPADPTAGPGQLRGGYWPDKPGNGEPTGFHYGALNTEPRMASYLGIADGSLPTDHYWHLSRTLLPGMGQEQQPEGTYVTVDGVRVWQGHYTYRGRKLVPTWGGSMFEALMVPLFVPEAEWSPKSWGTTHRRYVRSQIEHGLMEEKYGYWGFSPANIPEGGYREYGVDAIGMQQDGYNTLGVVTPPRLLPGPAPGTRRGHRQPGGARPGLRRVRRPLRLPRLRQRHDRPHQRLRPRPGPGNDRRRPGTASAPRTAPTPLPYRRLPLPGAALAGQGALQYLSSGLRPVVAGALAGRTEISQGIHSLLAAALSEYSALEEGGEGGEDGVRSGVPSGSSCAAYASAPA